ncbi:MAG TPA: helix-hairpin-helix domain-containing protein [Thermoanaerobaculia bacterium]|jgi:competence protein ComEA|nr:helix-hairpin-helix domain-containing protein [Thermoanaerobaculia bacterium]MDI9631153.1 helix-hairpin-helix domain-containing protein [Acidobacteriota bacterium]MBP7812410.1 helix-hairpin-helix domain-containing protein [Thermoanaerobaculia bacterium]MBP8844420.1 helix-hairpin-helix domain-containing protein [Thermoanaerobaculia bacterium]HNU82232.1 helix-hairpin-helix domain-containing protein [Thermoanaerobaculia bacterium]
MIRTLRITSLILAAALLFGVLPAFAAEGKVNINTASVEQLQLLPRIGPAVAQRIVEHREKNGAFKAATDLMLVRGIGEKSYELLAPYVATSGATTLAEKVRVPRPQKAEGAS